MKKIIFFLLSFSIYHLPIANAQPGEWTWMHGANFTGSAGNHGIQGVADPANDPVAVYEGNEWTDLNGNFWHYGGVSSGIQPQNDLWKYDPLIQQWTWMHGTNTPNDPGSFGTIGIPSPANRPPAKGWCAGTWTDLNNNLWLFGGTSGSRWSDMWKYDITTNEWTWMNGPSIGGQPGVYGTQGVPDPANYPPGRDEIAATWTDNNGDLWLFGGRANGAGEHNDLWRYTISNNSWTWMKGANFTGQPGVYGTLGVEDPLNTPGFRWAYCRWKDNSGNLWLFGGDEYSGTGPHNDLWRYNPLTNNWTWMNGSNAANAISVYGTKCVTSPTNTPGARYENRACWTDINGNFWMMGGASGYFTEIWGDLWMYCVSTNVWTWMGGDNTGNPIASHGTMGVSSPTNQPDGRCGHNAWYDRSGYLYMWGGSTFTFLTPYNDMWRFEVDFNCGSCSGAPPVVNFVASDRHICPNECISFTNFTTGAVSYQWFFPGGNPSSSTDVNPAFICYDSTGLYSVTLIATNTFGSDTITLNNLIEVYPQPTTPTITQGGDTLFANTGYATYQWYFGSDTIPGATNSFYVATQSGNYNLAVTDDNGCSVGAGIVNVIASLTPDLSKGEGARVFPNPAKDNITVSIVNGQSSMVSFELFNSLGQQIYSCRDAMYRVFTKEISLKDFADGIYLLKISLENPLWRTGDKMMTKKIIVSR